MVALMSCILGYIGGSHLIMHFKIISHQMLAKVGRLYDKLAKLRRHPSMVDTLRIKQLWPNRILKYVRLYSLGFEYVGHFVHLHVGPHVHLHVGHLVHFHVGHHGGHHVGHHNVVSMLC